MRPANSNGTQYQPEDPPADPSQFRVYLMREFAKMKAALDAVSEGFAPVVYVIPPKPRAGMLRNFDGVQANPGSGAGLYRYNGAVWIYLG